MKNTTMNICNTCEFDLPECEAKSKDVEYGNGKGNDNVIKCKCYKQETKFNDGCCPNCGCETFSDCGLGRHICCKCGEIYNL